MLKQAMLTAASTRRCPQTFASLSSCAAPRNGAVFGRLSSRFSFSQAVKNDSKEMQNGFVRLTRHYKERKAMKGAILDMENAMTFNHLPYGIRFFMFLNRIKFRIFFLVSIGALFNYWGNLLGIFTSRMERVFKKYKKRWIFKHNRPAMTYATALETTYEPERLSRVSTEKLSKFFVKIDRELEHGFSRQLVADALYRMELMDKKKDEAKFLDGSGHMYIRSKKLNSMSLKEFLIIMEEKIVDVACKDNPVKEFECVDKFIEIVDEDKTQFLERAMAEIKEAEMTPYEHRQRKLKQEAEAKRLKEEALKAESDSQTPSKAK